MGTEALAALGIAHAALMVVMTLGMGMAVGTLAGVARSIGARRPGDAAAVFGQGVLISLVTGTLLALSALFVPPWIMAFMGAEPAVAQPATDYLAVGLLGQLVGAPLMVVTFALQGAGEANAALKVSAVSPIVYRGVDDGPRTELRRRAAGVFFGGRGWCTMASEVRRCAAGSGSSR